MNKGITILINKINQLIRTKK